MAERLEFDLLFRWFVGLGVDYPAWTRACLEAARPAAAGEVAQRFLPELLALPEVEVAACRASTSRWTARCSRPGPASRASAARMAATRRRGRAATASATSGGRRRANPRQHHHPDARLYRKGNGQPAELRFIGHALMENRNGLIVGGSGGLRYRQLHPGMPGGERHPARGAEHHRDPRLAHRRPHHPAPPGYAPPCASASASRRASAGAKEIAGLAQVKLRRLGARVDCAFVLGLAAYNLVRLPKLLAEASP